jgi:DNA-binding response OmpR family regulator
MRYRPLALVLSADRHLRRLIDVTLDESGYTPLNVATDAGAEDIDGTLLSRVKLVVVNVRGSDMLHADLIRELREHEPALKVLYLLDRKDPASTRSLFIPWNDRYLRKPFRWQELSEIVSCWPGHGDRLMDLAVLTSLN